MPKAGCHATPRAQETDLPRIQRSRHQKSMADFDCVCEQRTCARGNRDCEQSSVSQLNLSVIQAKNIHLERQCNFDCKVIVNACQEYEELSLLATANLERRCQLLELAHPPACENTANSLRIHNAPLLKTGASRQEKSPACNGNGAATDEHFSHGAILDGCTGVNTAGTQHLDSLFDHNFLTACGQTVTYEIRNSTA